MSKGFEMLDVEAALTMEEKTTFLDRMTARNPGWRGAHVADLLDVMDDSDAHIDIVEPLCEAHPDEWTKTHSYAAQVACVLLYPTRPIWADVTAIVDRIPA